jgi:hypothetical protein
MPHVVFRGHVTLAQAWEKFQPHVRQEGEWISKLTDCFLSTSGREMLVEAMAVCRGVTHNFYVRVNQKQEQVTVRIEPRTNVEKNDGVKWAVAMAASWMKTVWPELIIDKSNLPPEMLTTLEARQ